MLRGGAGKQLRPAAQAGEMLITQLCEGFVKNSCLCGVPACYSCYALLCEISWCKPRGVILVIAACTTYRCATPAERPRGGALRVSMAAIVPSESARSGAVGFHLGCPRHAGSVWGRFLLPVCSPFQVKRRCMKPVKAVPGALCPLQFQ